MHQKSEQAERPSVVTGESGGELERDEARGPQRENDDTGSVLLNAMLTRENLQQSWKRVKANQGAAGVDGLDIQQTAEVLKTEWPNIREKLLQGQYRPRPVAAGDDTQAERKSARTGHPDGAGSADPASIIASTSTHHRSYLQ